VLSLRFHTDSAPGRRGVVRFVGFENRCVPVPGHCQDCRQAGLPGCGEWRRHSDPSGRPFLAETPTADFFYPKLYA